MLVYALAVVVIGQITWYRALTSLPAARVATWTLLVPVLGMIFAVLLVDEMPNAYQWAGATIILVGMGIGQIRRGPRATYRA